MTFLYPVVICLLIANAICKNMMDPGDDPPALIDKRPLAPLDFLKYQVTIEKSLSPEYDSVVIVGSNIEPTTWGVASSVGPAFEALKAVDKSFNTTVSISAFNNQSVIFSPTGKLTRDFDDVRSFSDAAEKGIKRAIAAGAKKPLVVLPTEHGPFSEFSVDSGVLLGALKAIYVPLQKREADPKNAKKLEKLGFLNFNGDQNRLLYLLGLEEGNVAFRDISIPDPERMTPVKVEEYVKQLFPDGGRVKVTVISDRKVLEEKYPCLAAVDRCAQHIPRHSARVILLEYTDGTPEQVLGFVGKGVTFDTGGANIKGASSMKGMSRDKSGAAAVAGLFTSLNQSKPKNITVWGALCLVRNSIGSDAYLMDEVITSRAGVRIRITNTDAEGRMAMLDALAEMKERVLEGNLQDRAQLFTLATLTGAAKRAVGAPYAIAIDNGPAKKKKTSEDLQTVGEKVGDFLELGRIRREDFEAIASMTPDDDIKQTSSSTDRGFQYPAVFLMKGSGLDKHGLDSEKPIAFTHLDIAASASNFPDAPSSCPISALNYKYFFSR